MLFQVTVSVNFCWCSKRTPISWGIPDFPFHISRFLTRRNWQWERNNAIFKMANLTLVLFYKWYTMSAKTITLNGNFIKFKKKWFDFLCYGPMFNLHEEENSICFLTLGILLIGSNLFYFFFFYKLRHGHPWARYKN